MSAIAYDFYYSAAFCLLAESEGLLGPNSGVKSLEESSPKVIEFTNRIAPVIYSDLVLYDQVIVPDYSLSTFADCDPDLFRLKDTFEVPRRPHSVDRGIIKTYVEQDFLRFAVQLKPFFLERIMADMARDEKNLQLWSPIVRCGEMREFGEDFSDLYDFFFVWMVSDANSALGCIRNYELRMLILDWLVASLYYDGEGQTRDGFRMFVLEDDTLFEGFTNLLNRLWEPCSLVEYSSLFGVPVRASTINTKPVMGSTFASAVPREFSPREILDSRKTDAAYVILKNELNRHIHVTPGPNNIAEALAMREKKGWKRFREQLARYEELFAGGVSDRLVAEEVVRDIKLAQKGLDRAKQVKRIVNFASISMATLELFLTVPSIANFALAIIGQAFSSRANEMVNFNSWILLGDMSSSRKPRRRR